MHTINGYVDRYLYKEKKVTIKTSFSKGLVLLINSNPLPADGASDDYGDFNGTAAEISNKKRPANNKTSSGTGYNDEDPIGDIVGDILAGAGFLVSTGIGLIQGVASGEVSSDCCNDTTAV